MDWIYILILSIGLPGLIAICSEMVRIWSVYKAMYVIKNIDILSAEWDKATNRLQELEKPKGQMTKAELIEKRRLIKKCNKNYSWGVYLNSDVRKIMTPQVDLFTNIPKNIDREGLLLKELNKGIIFLLIGLSVWLIIIIAVFIMINI